MLKVIASSLNLRSAPSTSAPILESLPMGTSLTPIDPGPFRLVRTPTGKQGWVHANYVSEQEQVDASSSPSIKVPHGIEEVRRVFGEPGNPDCEAGRVRLAGTLVVSWSPKEKITSFACHRLVAPAFQEAFDAIQREGLWSLLHDYGGCYANRKIRGSATSVSTHAWGIAVDLNVTENPLGTTPKMDGRIVAIFKRYGFAWGGDFKRRDGMHFQFATGI